VAWNEHKITKAVQYFNVLTNKRNDTNYKQAIDFWTVGFFTQFHASQRLRREATFWRHVQSQHARTCVSCNIHVMLNLPCHFIITTIIILNEIYPSC
jgi:hypothetical protein